VQTSPAGAINKWGQAGFLITPIKSSLSPFFKDRFEEGSLFTSGNRQFGKGLAKKVKKKMRIAFLIDPEKREEKHVSKLH
jgi:hypothetical protein